MVEILKQGQYSPVPVEKQVLIIYAGTNGFLDDLPVDQCRAFEAELYQLCRERASGILSIDSRKEDAGRRARRAR